MSTPTNRARHEPERELAPIRWPHPGWAFLALLGVWLVGLMLAVFVPALIVPPGENTAPTGDVLLALGCTFLGAMVMLGVGLAFWRRHEDPVATTFGVVPAIAVIAGGVIMAATKLTGT
jgi:hypothetical protein